MLKAAKKPICLPAISQAMAATLAYATLSYQVGAPSTRGTANRAAAVMQEQQYKLNNYMLPGPLTPLADQARSLSTAAARRTM